MRLILFFDLPMEKSTQKREYSRFLKYLKSLGFYMLQKSVYIKLCMDSRVSDSMISQIRKNVPKEGTIAVLSVTEKQFADINFLLGDSISDVINSDERLIEL